MRILTFLIGLFLVAAIGCGGTDGPVNSAPSEIVLSSSSVPESSPVGTVVGTLIAIDPDQGDTHTFELLDNASEFEILGNELRTAAELDMAVQASYELAIRATDSGGLSRDERVDVNLVASEACETGTTGGGAPHDLMQPSLALRYLIASTDSEGDDFYSTGDVSAGDVTLFAGNFAPSGWLSADGQELAIADFPKLFAAVGTTYGGDGVHTFVLPDLRGRAAIFQGQDEGLTNRTLGWSGGSEQWPLSVDELATHSHAVTEPSGSSAEKPTVQPVAVLLGGIVPVGIPTSDPKFLADGRFTGRILMTIANQLPNAAIPADGAILPISRNDPFAPNNPLYRAIGSSFGGDGEATFAIPSLSGRAVVSAGEGPGLSARPFAWTGGQETVSLSEAQIAEHSHSLPAGQMSERTRGGEAHSNMQPSIALRYIIRLDGQFPSRDPGLPVKDFIGEVALFAGDYAPYGWALADGVRLQIVENTTLYAIIGWYFGGDGLETFALPDLRGRVPVHVGEGPGLTMRTRGWQGGAEEVTLNESQLAPHAHALEAQLCDDVRRSAVD